MPMYNYKVRDAAGNVRIDMTEALNELVLVEKLQEKGYFVIKVVESLDLVQSAQQYDFKKEPTKFTHDATKLEDLLIFSRQLATMLDSGVPLMRSLDVIVNQITSKQLHAVLQKVRSDVQSGKSLSQALGKHTTIFGQFWVCLVEVGEASGALPVILTKLAVHVEEEEAFRSAISTALVYPMILAVASVGAVIFFALFVAPRFEEIFASMHADLPLMTRILLGVFKFIKVYFVLLAAGIGLGLFMGMNYIKTPLGKLQWEQFIFNLPVVGEVVKLILMERFASQMSILVGSGVPILLSLDIVARLLDNSSCSLLVGKIHDEVREGKGLADSMEKDSFFPGMAVQMIKVGEETGELSKMLEHVAKYYKNNVNAFVKRFATIIEPFMLVFMAFVIGVIVLSIFLPLFKLGQGGHH
ncbi:MAG: type II secretion system F family protein [Candidatus Omnitrophica bacterium]|nr:type II secretion system F family protein [Candidatus Omnitrophota bacterium]